MDNLDTSVQSSLEHENQLDNDNDSINVNVNDNKINNDHQTVIKQATAVVLLSFCQFLSARIMNLPLLRLIESRYCLNYYLQHDRSVIPSNGGFVPEHLCKLSEIQQDVAWFFGVYETLYIASDLLVAIPFARLSEKYGLRFVLKLNTSALILMFSSLILLGSWTKVPVTVALVGPIFILIGGADCVFSSSSFATLAQIAPNARIRTNLFAYVTSAEYVTALTGPAISAVLMSFGLYVPFAVGISLLFLAWFLFPFIPSIIPKHQLSDSENEETPLIAAPNMSTVAGSSISAPFRSLEFCLLLGTICLAAFASSSSTLFPRYLSVRYGLSLKSAGFILSTKAIVNVTLLSYVLPTLTWYLARRQPRSRDFNIAFALASLIASVLGAVLTAAAPSAYSVVPSLLVYSLGSALPVFTLSLVKMLSASLAAVAQPPRGGGGEGLSSPAPTQTGTQTQVHTLPFSIAELSKYTGRLIGVPIMAAIWAKGLGIGGHAMGAPYYASALAYTVALACVGYLGIIVGKRRDLDSEVEHVD